MPQESQAASLKQLVYVSQATVEPDPDGLLRIVRDSQGRNQRASITGVLFYFDCRFIQCLEGPFRAVDATMSRIRADRRHHDIEVLVDQPIAERLFAEWHMGNAPLTAFGWQRIARANWPTIAPLQGGIEGLEVLRALVQEEQEMTPVTAPQVENPARRPSTRRIVIGVLLLVSTGLALAWPFLG